jgi:hypothetical protein
MYILSFSNTSQFSKSLPYPACDLFIGIKFSGFKFTSSTLKLEP